MRALRLAIAAIIIAIATPVGAALPQLALACASAPAGQDVPCTISRVSGGRGVYVLFQTSDSTAKAGTDYTAVSKQVYLNSGTSSLVIAVHTLANPNATGTLTFNVALAGGAVVVRSVGSIVEPVHVPVPTPTPTPAPTPAPAPAPTGAWVLAPLVNDGYARCKTVGGCHAMGTTADYNPIIAQQGEVRQQAWNGCNGDVPVCRIVVALWPVNHDPRKTGVWSDWTLGKEGWQDEWEGVAPAP